MVLGSQRKTPKSLERAISRYEAKLAKAANPTQRAYASSMLRTAQTALAKSLEDGCNGVADPEHVVTLHRDEYEIR